MGRIFTLTFDIAFWAVLIALALAGSGVIDWVSRYVRARRVTEREFLLPSGNRVRLVLPKCAYEPLDYEPAGLPESVYDQERDPISLIDRMRPLPTYRVSNN